jgi:hypothetical protein
MKRFEIILSVPVEEGEDSPDKWYWQDLIGTSRDVHILAGPVEVGLLPTDLEDDDV